MASAEKGAAFVDTLTNAKPDAFSPHEVLPELLKVWREGMGRGDRTGWPSLDMHFSVAGAQLTSVTGYPNSGKSQFVDALAMNLARQGWRFVFCSLENIPVFLHAEKLVKQFMGKPMRDGPSPRMSEDELVEAATEIDDWFSFLLPTDAKPNPSVHDVIGAVEDCFKARELWGRPEGKLAVVIDPWNELEHFRPVGMSLTEYIGESLSWLRQWVRRTGVHLFIVAHPAKQLRARDNAKLPVATPDMISDSAHFWNKSDNCLTVALQDEHNTPMVDIHVQKIRFSHIGRRGMVTLEYDKLSGRYGEVWKGVSRAVST